MTVAELQEYYKQLMEEGFGTPSLDPTEILRLLQAAYRDLIRRLDRVDYMYNWKETEFDLTRTTLELSFLPDTPRKVFRFINLETSHNLKIITPNMLSEAGNWDTLIWDRVASTLTFVQPPRFADTYTAFWGDEIETLVTEPPLLLPEDSHELIVYHAVALGQVVEKNPVMQVWINMAQTMFNELVEQARFEQKEVRVIDVSPADYHL